MFGEMLVVYGTFIASLCPQSKSILITYWLFHRRRQSTTLFAVHLSVHCLRIVNDEGKRVTEKDFMGKWSLVYFGFTHCPDICPDELQMLVAALDKIKEKVGIEVVPVFISVDPERDTVEQVREYVKEFHPNLVGLTGSPDEIKEVARVYHMKTAEEDSEYLVDHSIVMYLMDPNMEFGKFFGKNNDVEPLTDDVIKESMIYTCAGRIHVVGQVLFFPPVVVTNKINKCYCYRILSREGEIISWVSLIMLFMDQPIKIIYLIIFFFISYFLSESLLIFTINSF